ncbi:hypothetical protein PI23P_06276 [Polaribacter irgensii 23-P]|uniref:Uncharacterized protein n=1 Tax=Polaribacter irgensii 23-P TaxID=313594 RepID=A4C354_9FLAO|nr:hypothetical protein PI23P_06276 [Polaribacter irgensii 23-P]
MRALFLDAFEISKGTAKNKINIFASCKIIFILFSIVVI